MARFIVDANVVAKWILPGEPYEDNALRLKNDSVSGQAELHAPDLLRYEVGNTLCKASKKSRISTSDVAEALEALDGMKINLHRDEWDDTIEAYKIADSLGLTVYDATYINLGRRLSAPVLTADERILKNVSSSRISLRLIHIKDY